MDKIDNIKKLAITLPAYFIISLSYLYLSISGRITTEVRAFAIDSYERIYVGTSKQIEVYENGELIYTISPQTSRTYVFTIQEDDTILLSTTTKVYVMDLKGNVIESWDDSSATTYNAIKWNYRKYISKTGQTYELKGILGSKKIVKNDNEVIYELSVLSKIFIWLKKTINIIFVVCVYSIIKEELKNKNSVYNRTFKRGWWQVYKL